MVTKEEIEMLADYVPVTLKIPKEVAEWFKDSYTATLEERLTAEIVEVCYAQIDAVTPKMIVNRYPGLKETFKEYGLDIKHL